MNDCFAHAVDDSIMAEYSPISRQGSDKASYDGSQTRRNILIS